MPTGEHVHIISAGENIHTAYPAIFRTLPTITRTYVLADSTIYELSSNPDIEKERLAVRNAVTAAKEIIARHPLHVEYLSTIDIRENATFVTLLKKWLVTTARTSYAPAQW